MEQLKNCGDFMKCGFGPDCSKTKTMAFVLLPWRIDSMRCMAVDETAGPAGLLIIYL